MLSKTEIEFLKNPEGFGADYRRVMRHRVKAKAEEFRVQIALLQGYGAFEGTGLSVTENCNGVTEFCNGQNNQKSPNQAALVKMWWAEPDSDRRPLARKANVLTRLDDRPTGCLIKRLHWLILEFCFLKWLFI
jgi:hypothetical protein